jgi:hypothetical protein
VPRRKEETQGRKCGEGKQKINKRDASGRKNPFLGVTIMLCI